jgi:hypothetical protein
LQRFPRRVGRLQSFGVATQLSARAMEAQKSFRSLFCDVLSQQIARRDGQDIEFSCKACCEGTLACTRLAEHDHAQYPPVGVGIHIRSGGRTRIAQKKRKGGLSARRRRELAGTYSTSGIGTEAEQTHRSSWVETKAATLQQPHPTPQTEFIRPEPEHRFAIR